MNVQEKLQTGASNSRQIVNNIFISNLNINLNLNINISIPPSPKSTRNNNQSILESYGSDLIPDNHFMNKKSSRNHHADNPYDQQPLMTDKREDLSQIDDEMPLQQQNHKVNINIKQHQDNHTHQQPDVQGLINNLIQPEIIYKSIGLPNASAGDGNNIFINNCQVNQVQ